MKLTEITQQKSIFTDEQLAWCKKNIDHFIETDWRKDGDGFSVSSTVNILGSDMTDVALGDGETDQIPFKIKEVEGSFSTNDSTKFKDLTNFPDVVNGFLTIQSPTFESFKGGNKIKVKAAVEILSPKLTSLKGIDKAFESIGQTFDVQGYVKEAILGLVKIGVHCRVLIGGTDHEELNNAFKIVNKYKKEGLKGVVKAQRELIEADLDDYAEL